MKNPCIKLCTFEKDVCCGCGRTRQEIKRWKKLDKAERRAILAEAQQRLATLRAKARRKKKA